MKESGAISTTGTKSKGTEQTESNLSLWIMMILAFAVVLWPFILAPVYHFLINLLTSF